MYDAAERGDCAFLEDLKSIDAVYGIRLVKEF